MEVWEIYEFDYKMKNSGFRLPPQSQSSFQVFMKSFYVLQIKTLALEVCISWLHKAMCQSRKVRSWKLDYLLGAKGNTTYGMFNQSPHTDQEALRITSLVCLKARTEVDIDA